MYVRIRYKKKGGHYHCRVFTGAGANFTLALAGELVFDDEQWVVAHARLSRFADAMINEGEE